MGERVGITIIGGGVVGLSLARALARPGGPDVVVLERNPSFRAENQSTGEVCRVSRDY